MKNLIFALFTLLSATTAAADDEFGLYIVTGSETTTTNVSSLQKISFNNGNVVVLTTDGVSASTPMSDITKMYFGIIEKEVTGITGDVNGDGKVNISDVVAVINQIAGVENYERADVNSDTYVNITDVVDIINIISGDTE